MRCEVCGRSIIGKPFKTIVEGARLMVCKNCAPLGSGEWDTKLTSMRSTQMRKPRKTSTFRSSKLKASSRRKSPLDESFELVGDYSSRIRRAREALGLSHEKLGRKIGEKVSVLKKLEGRRMKPDDKLAKKLQYALKVKLLVATKDEKFLPKTSGVSTTPLTLGDLIKNRKDESEEAK